MSTTFNIQIGALPFAIIKNEKPNGTDGGPSIVGWQTRELNSVYSTIGGLELSSNKIKLPPGTYLVQAKAPAYIAGPHKIVLYNTDTSTNEIIGTSVYSHPDSFVNNISEILGVVTIDTDTNFCIRHYISRAENAGLGNPVSNAGLIEVHTMVYIVKLN